MTNPQQTPLAEVLTLVPPPAVAFSLDANGTAKLITSRPCLLYGWTVTNAAGAVTERCDIYDGRDATGQMVAHLEAPAGSSNTTGPAAPGILCREGLYIGNVGADVMLSVYVVLL